MVAVSIESKPRKLEVVREGWGGMRIHPSKTLRVERRSRERRTHVGLAYDARVRTPQISQRGLERREQREHVRLDRLLEAIDYALKYLLRHCWAHVTLWGGIGWGKVGSELVCGEEDGVWLGMGMGMAWSWG